MTTTTTTTLPILGQTITFAPSLLQTASPLSTAQQTPVGPTLGKMHFMEMIMMMVAIVIEIMKVMIVIEIMMMMNILIHLIWLIVPSP